VDAGTLSGSPALMTAWRAGFWPAPAASTWPMMTSLTAAGSMPVFAISCLITCAPSSVAGIFERVPPNLPMAVRPAATMTTSSISVSGVPAEGPVLDEGGLFSRKANNVR
jgi:hypothetical protein